MDTSIDQKAAQTTTGRRESFLDNLTQKIGTVARTSTVFGEPVERDGVLVIPVAKARWGLGGGDGTDAKGNEGSGGGGGLTITPVGYIEVKNGNAQFKPIYDPALLVQIILASGFVAMLVLRGVRKLVRR